MAKPSPKPGKRRKVMAGSSPTHLDLVRELPCILSGRPAEAAHIRYADAFYGKADTGVGRKPDDMWCLPLAPELHRLNNGCQHASGDERAWWRQFKIDPLFVAKQLVGKNRLQMERIITMHQPWDSDVKAKVLAILRNEKKGKP